MTSCRLFLGISLALFAASPFAAPAADSSRNACSRAIPDPAPSLPAAVVVGTRCGRFRLEPSGRVVYKGSEVLPVPRGASYWPADLTWYRFDRGHLVIGRAHTTVWRSRERYPGTYPGNVGLIALGRHELSFSYYRNLSRPAELYVVRYGGAERRAAVGESPLAFTPSGELVTVRDGWHTLVLRSARGRFERVLARHASDPQWDRGNRRVLFRLRDRLLVFDGAGIKQLVRLKRLGIHGLPTVEPRGRVIAVHDRRKLVLLDLEGRLVASTVLQKAGRGDGVSSSVVANGTGTTVAFAATTGSVARETVYVLSVGQERARPLFRRAISRQGCGRSTDLAWHGRWLLYSTTEQRAAVIDSTARAAAIDLSAVIARVPGASREGFFAVEWAR